MFEARTTATRAGELLRALLDMRATGMAYSGVCKPADSAVAGTLSDQFECGRAAMPAVPAVSAVSDVLAASELASEQESVSSIESGSDSDPVERLQSENDSSCNTATEVKRWLDADPLLDSVLAVEPVLGLTGELEAVRKLARHLLEGTCCADGGLC